MNKEITNAKGDIPLVLAAANTDYASALIEAGAEVNGRHQDDARTALIEAVKGSNIKSVHALLKAGACPKLRDAMGKSALHYARHGKKAEIITALQDALEKSASKPGGNHR